MSGLSPAVLKSVLQKSVRRRSPSCAVAAAAELARKDLPQLLRRLPIIIVEDANLVDCRFAAVVWMMMADSKGVDVLGVVGEGALMRVVWEVASAAFRRSRVEGKEGGSYADEAKLEDAECALRAACLMREKYGGMKGDQEMLRAAAGRVGQCAGPDVVAWVRKRLGGVVDGTWSAVADAVYSKASEVQGSPWSKPLRLTSSVVCEAGIDFHCSDILDDILRSNAGKVVMKGVHVALGLEGMEEVKEEMMKAMWENEAGVNLKVTLADDEDGKEEEMGEAKRNRKIAFDLLAPFFKRWRSEYLERRCSS